MKLLCVQYVQYVTRIQYVTRNCCVTGVIERVKIID